MKSVAIMCVAAVLTGFAPLLDGAENTLPNTVGTDDKTLPRYVRPDPGGAIVRQEAGLPVQANASATGGVRGAERGQVRAGERGQSRAGERGTERGVERALPGVTTKMAALVLPIPARMEPIAPMQTGYTNKAQPAVYFYLSDPSSDPIEFTLNSANQIEPVYTTAIKPDTESGRLEAGFHRIDFAQFGITLEPAIEYEWFVAIVLSEDERSIDFLAGGAITYRPQTPALAAELDALNSGSEQFALARHGVWYDAIDSLAARMNTGRDSDHLRRQLIALLDQEKLVDATRYLRHNTMAQ